MKKSFPWILIVICVALLFCLIVGISYNVSASYENATTPTYKDFGGYFSVLKEWKDAYMGDCKILYTDDTHIMYFYFDGNYISGITPLYNADGTLQIYEGE